MRRLPLLPTLMVLVAVPTMIALGFWQLHRAEWKAGLLARLAANAEAPVIDKPADLRSNREALSFRRVRVTCADVRPWQPSAARAADGSAGYRQQIWCGGQGDPILVSIGVAQDPSIAAAVARGASFVGPLVPRDGRGADDPLFVLIAEAPISPLKAEAAPSHESIPDNHRSYAVQWFLFALVLSVIYAVFLRQQARK